MPSSKHVNSDPDTWRARAKTIQETVESVCKGEKRKLEKLLDMMEPLIKRWCYLLGGGRPISCSRMERRVISLCTKNKELRTRSNRGSITAFFIAAKQFQRLTNILPNVIEEEDVRSDVITILMELIRAYDPSRGIYFLAYLERMFPYKIYHYITREKGTEIMSWEGKEELPRNQPGPTLKKVPPFKMNIRWILGQTVKEPFNQLSSLDRQILVMTYIHEMNDVEIAQKLLASRQAIQQKRTSILAKLRKLFQDNPHLAEAVGHELA